MTARGIGNRWRGPVGCMCDHQSLWISTIKPIRNHLASQSLGGKELRILRTLTGRHHLLGRMAAQVFPRLHAPIAPSMLKAQPHVRQCKRHSSRKRSSTPTSLPQHAGTSFKIVAVMDAGTCYVSTSETPSESSALEARGRCSYPA